MGQFHDVLHLSLAPLAPHAGGAFLVPANGLRGSHCGAAVPRLMSDHDQSFPTAGRLKEVIEMAVCVDGC